MSNLLRGFAVREFVVGEFLPVSQTCVDVVEDMEVFLSPVNTKKGYIGC